MNIYKELNEVIEYIENHLEDKIDYNILAKKLGINVYVMQRLFTLLAGISISEYIRNRRLSNAGSDLQVTDNKVIQIAIKYQYESATAFSRAFEKFHGIKPSAVKENANKLKIFTKIIFEESLPKHKNIEYKVVNCKQLELYGKGIKTTLKKIKTEAPNFFKVFSKKYIDKYGNPNYGMVIYEDRFKNCNIEYWVLYDKEIKDLEKQIIPEGKWIVIKINSQEAKEIQEVSNSFYVDFLPSSKYILRNIPELEYYHDNITELYIPLED